jgi:L-cysteine/cystine lyase
MNDSLKLQQIRAQLPAVQHGAYLNTGGCGPLPGAVADAMAEAAEYELQTGRADPTASFDFLEKIHQTRSALAHLFNVDPATIALTHNTTEGMNIVAWGLEWQPRDEVITTNLEHPGALYPLYAVSARRGVILRFADIGTGADPLPAIERALTPRTRLLVVSHVSYSSGAGFPLEEIIRLVHSRDAMVAVDGAQSAGVFDIDLTELNVDFYAISGQKWLCGPEGTGALYVRADRLADLQQTFVGFSSFERHDWQGHYLPTAGAARYHTGTVYKPGIIGHLAALRWYQETVDPVWAYARIARMAKRCRELLHGLDGVLVITPRHRQAGLVNLAPLHWSPRQMVGLTYALIDRGYVIRAITHPPYCLRISTGFFNTDDELLGLRDTLGELLDAGPNAVEIPELAFELPDDPVWN